MEKVTQISLLLKHLEQHGSINVNPQKALDIIGANTLPKVFKFPKE